MHKKALHIILILILFLILAPAAFASSDEAHEVELTPSATGFEFSEFLTDDDINVYYEAHSGATIKLDADSPFCSLYILLNIECGEYIILDNENELQITAGKNGFLHEFVELAQPTTSVTIIFTQDYVSISEIRAFTAGIPAGVQIWEPPLEGGCDLLLMSTHGDDEHLFFAGLLPMYGCEQGYTVQVCYFTNHRDWTYARCHEMLNGLWAVGIRNYPQFGTFTDFRIDDKDATYRYYEFLGVSKTDMLDYCVEQIRRFRPQVVVGHDFKGEYGHGMHQVYADQVSQAIYLTNDPNYFPSSAEKYGLWDVPKTYFHVYEENIVELEIDAPLRSFAGMSAFNVSRHIGFPQHVSQQEATSFTNWIYGINKEITSSKEITLYSPRYYGLFRSTVGPDVEKNDLMENTKTYNERKQAEEAAHLEAERVLAKMENERLAAIEAEKQAELNKRLEEKRLKEEEEARRKEQHQMTLVLIALGVLALLSGGGALITRLVKNKKKVTAETASAEPAQEPAETDEATVSEPVEDTEKTDP